MRKHSKQKENKAHKASRRLKGRVSTASSDAEE
jgi:hypothetical protein